MQNTFGKPSAEPTAPHLVLLGEMSERNRARVMELANGVESITSKMLGEEKTLDPALPSPYGGRIGEAIAAHNEIGYHLDRIQRSVERWHQAMG